MTILILISLIVIVIKFKRKRLAEHVARKKEGKRAFEILTGKPIRKRPLGRPRHRSKDNIRIDLKYESNSIDSNRYRNHLLRALHLCMP